jgi:hypothetical protein
MDRQLIGFETAPVTGLLRRAAPLAEGVARETRWHVSALVDMSAYHFSWLWVLLPMTLLGDSRFNDYLVVYALVLGANFAHRHYGLPYAYFDRQIFETHKRKLLVFPLLCLALFALTPAVLSGSFGGQAGKHALNAVVFFSLLWNFWHVYMQKYGILRVYMVKAPIPQEHKTPPWVDRLFVLCWFPLYFSYVGPARKQLIYDNGKPVLAYTEAVISFMEAHQSLLVLPSALIAAAALVLFGYHEYRAHRLQNRARISAALGTTLLSSSLLWVDPIKVYLAFGFSHAVEYMVFVWAFQRKRYAEKPDDQREPQPASLMSRLLEHPWLFYGIFTAGLAAVAMVKAVWGRWIFVGLPPVTVLGMTGMRWFRYYAVFESLVHFYTDGFLWKMRRPEVRANI